MEFSPTRSASDFLTGALRRFRPGLLFGVLILSALLAFELFNYSTTDYALRDLLGNLQFAGIPWATILAIAFCGMDFAGIARLFTPEQGADEPKEVWYLFGAWLLAATMNAVLTWWGVSMAIANHAVASVAVVDARVITQIVPIFVAVLVWIIRILVIGTLSTAGERIFSDMRKSSGYSRPRTTAPSASVPVGRPLTSTPAARPTASNPAPAARPYPRPLSTANVTRPEPSYHSLSGQPVSRTSAGDPPARG